jgi:defect-in-organelle-trafficking protein DotC
MPKFKTSLTIALLVVSFAFLPACRKPPYLGDTESLSGLKAMRALRVTNKKMQYLRMSRMREMAIRDSALSLGAQAGLAWRANTIDKELTKQAHLLSTVYDFNSLMLENDILPPVLLEGRNTLNLADAQTIRISDRVYKLTKQARFVTTPPNWRQYIWMDYKKPEYPDQSLLPRTRLERKVWCRYVAQGWSQGLEQADNILEESIARLKEDFTGMILYRKLLAMNMVSAPYVSHIDLGVTGDEAEMHIDDRVLRITALPLLNINSKEWRAAVAKDENVLANFRNMEKLAANTKIDITSRAWQPIIAPVNVKNANNAKN